MASTLVRYSDEVPKPSTDRLPEFADARLEGLKFALQSSAPIYVDMEGAQLASWLDDAQTMHRRHGAGLEALPGRGGRRPPAASRDR